jgi:hypothetical protein
MRDNHGGMISPNVKTGLLVAAHVVATPTAAWLLPPVYPGFVPNAIYVAWEATTLAQLALLSIWLALGAAKLRWRLALVVLGLVFENACDKITFVRTLDMYLAPIPVATIVLVLLGTRLHVVRYDKPPTNAPAFQFNLRQMMAFVFGTALLSLVGMKLHNESQLDAPWPFYWCISEAVCTAIIAPCSAWATLTPGRPYLRVLAVIGIALGVGAWEVYSLNLGSVPRMIVIAPVQATIAIASLLVVRSAGWRLVPRQRGLAT